MKSVHHPAPTLDGPPSQNAKIGVEGQIPHPHRHRHPNHQIVPIRGINIQARKIHPDPSIKNGGKNQQVDASLVVRILPTVAKI